MSNVDEELGQMDSDDLLDEVLSLRSQVEAFRGLVQFLQRSSIDRVQRLTKERDELLKKLKENQDG